MFDSIRSAMKTPLARPPGRRGWLRWFAPEIWALVIYDVLFLIWVARMFPYHPDNTGDGWLAGIVPPWWSDLLVSAAFIAYFLAGLVLLFGAITSGALAWARERDQGTLESLLLTSIDFSTVASVRFWHVLWPWAKLMLYLLPIYLLMSGDMCFGGSGWYLITQAFESKPVLGLFWILDGPYPGPYWSLAKSLQALLRFVNDFSIVMFACATAYFISVRARSGSWALVTSCLLAPLALFTILAPQDLLLVLWHVLPGTGNVIETIRRFSGIGAFIARLWLALWLVRRAARNFDWYALGEKPPT